MPSLSSTKTPPCDCLSDAVLAMRKTPPLEATLLEYRHAQSCVPSSSMVVLDVGSPMVARSHLSVVTLGSIWLKVPEPTNWPSSLVVVPEVTRQPWSVVRVAAARMVARVRDVREWRRVAG